MAYPGDPRARPNWARCVITATGTIKRNRDELIGRTVVCWLNGNSHDTNPDHVNNALDEQLRISRCEARVVKHYPEQYLVFFFDSRAYHRTIGIDHITSCGRVFNFAPWTECRYAMASKFKFRVKLRIESLPVHAWNEEVVAQVIGGQCAIHYVEEHSRRCDRTRTYDLWAWCLDPTKVPKGVFLTITNPDREGGNQFEYVHDPPTDYKGAFDYKLKIHLDIVEDLIFRHGGDIPPNRKPRREFEWSYGALDSQGVKRATQHGTGNHASRDYHPRRDDYDDDHRRGTRRHRSSSAWSRVSRCHGGLEDCYSATRFHGRGGNYGQSSYRSRRGTPPPPWGFAGEKMKTKQQIWIPRNKKKVSFADPLFQVFGESSESEVDVCFPVVNVHHETCLLRFDPMLDELLPTPAPAGYPTKDDYIREMLNAPGWEPIASPKAVAAEVEKGMLMEDNTSNPGMPQVSDTLTPNPIFAA
jgi:hypothetical protein